MPVDKKLPRYLYKYRNINSFAREIVKSNQIYLAKYSEINDPFEGKPYINITFKSVEDVKAYAAKTVDRQSLRLSKEERDNLIDEYIYTYMEPDKVQLQPFLQSSMETNIANQFGTFCMCEERDNILMWSHYTNGHRGICLEFDTSYEPFCREAKNVIYSKYLPQWHLDGNDDNAREIVRTKSDQWSYEKEWRVVLISQGISYINPKSLTGIIFGCAIEPKSIEEVKSWLSKRKKKPKLYQAQRNRRCFSLDIVEC